MALGPGTPVSLYWLAVSAGLAQSSRSAAPGEWQVPACGLPYQQYYLFAGCIQKYCAHAPAAASLCRRSSTEFFPTPSQQCDQPFIRWTSDMMNAAHHLTV
eukprot:GHRR01036196.1.p1 GENE.GHRR01036196.1~~GHRR01036196.1.p1  ORF type:complete len:101 (-),score=16.16 GHRR01036196.1:7-309(-)